MRRKNRPVQVAIDPGATTDRGGEPAVMLRARALAAGPKTSAHDTDADCPCCVCGGPADRSEPHWGPWRLHRHCQSVKGSQPSRLVAAARALALPEIDWTEASLLRFACPAYADAHPEPVWTDEPMRVRLPWRHLDRARFADAIAELPALRVEAGLDPSTCVSGSCAWCGRLESAGWGSYGHRWADGTEAPLCRDCGRIYEAAGEPDPAWWEGQRDGIAQAITFVPVMMGETPPAGLLAYAEGEGASDGTPWSHLPAESVEAFRWWAWGRFNGRYSPPEHRSEAVRRHQAAEAAKAARTAAKQAEDAARADVFGFSRHDEDEVMTR